MAKTEVATLAGGCFWCLEAAFQDLKGVEKVQSGYAGGHVANPSYEDVCTGTTGHAEVVQITFHPTVVSFNDPLVTEVKPLEAFYPAEEYHRDYYRRNPNQGYCNAVIAPKVAKVRKLYFDKLKQPVS